MKNVSICNSSFTNTGEGLMKIKYLLGTAPVALAVAVTGSSAAYAQVGEIVVTAERREESLQDTKISITALDSRAVQELGITEYTGIANIAPNLSMQDIPTSFGGAIGIRGFRNGETISTFEPKVALYLDGVLIAKNAGSAFSVLDLERIEVLRGPQGTLYGRNTVGGAVNLITKKPSSDLEGKLSLTIGDFGQTDFKAILNVPLLNSGDSELNLRATVGSLDRHGYYRNTFAGGPNKRFANSNRTVAHVQVQWEPSADVSVLYAFDKTWIDEVNPAPVLTRFNMTTKPELAPYVFSKSDQKKLRAIDYGMFVKGTVEGHSLTMEWDPSDTLSLVSITALRKLTYDSSQDADGTPVWVINTEAGDTTEAFTQEVRAVGDFADSRFEYVVGGFFMDEKIKEAYSHNYLPNAGGLFSNVDGTGRNKIWAIFGQGTFQITDKLDFTGGL
ncbi:MAG: TonB-dependent receptor, partial [Novosphingobium sp.]